MLVLRLRSYRPLFKAYRIRKNKLALRTKSVYFLLCFIVVLFFKPANDPYGCQSEKRCDQSDDGPVVAPHLATSGVLTTAHRKYARLWMHSS